MPVARNNFHSVDKPALFAIPTSNPIKKHPDKFTSSVPQGNTDMVFAWITTDSRYRKTPPIKLPNPTTSNSFMMSLLYTGKNSTSTKIMLLQINESASLVIVHGMALTADYLVSVSTIRFLRYASYEKPQNGRALRSLSKAPKHAEKSQDSLAGSSMDLLSLIIN